MSDKLQKNNFVREKIKEKPINKKRAALRLLFSALCGLVFAGIACLVFALIIPHIVPDSHGKEPVAETQTQDTQQLVTEDEEDTSTQEDIEQDTETEAESETETQAPTVEPETQVEEGDAGLEEETQQEELIDYELTIEDYQKIQNDLYAIGAEANNSIVTITSVKNDTDIFNNSYEMEGQESGVIVGDTTLEYLILAERRGINNASRISVTFIDGSMAEASLKKADGNTGLAILTVPKSDLPKECQEKIRIASFGNSNSVKSGMLAIALGSPLGTNYTILTGSITSTENEITTEDRNYSVFTTDIVASANGSGILINTAGEVIGIIMQGYGTQAAENTLTAVAASDLTPIISMLEKGKDIPYLGLHVSTVTSEIAKDYDIPDGVYIREVSMDSPAMKAGLQSGDVITFIGENGITTAGGYAMKVLSLSPDRTIQVVVKRKGANGYAEIRFDVMVGVLP